MKNRQLIEWEKSMNNEIEIEGMGKIKFEKLIGYWILPKHIVGVLSDLILFTKKLLYFLIFKLFKLSS